MTHLSADVKNKIHIMFRRFLPLLGAIALQLLLSLGVNLLDNFMLGYYSESAMSGASIVNQLHTLIVNLCFGIGAGVSVLGSQYWGRGDTAPIKKLFAIGLRCAFVCGLVFTLATLIFPDFILKFFTNDSVILAEAKSYLSIMSWTYVLFSMSYVLMLALAGIETAFIGSVMSFSTLIINFCINYLLIYGNFGLPRLGIKGAAYATLISRCVELLIVIVYLLFIDKKLKMRFKDLFRFKTGMIRDYVAVAFPSMLTGASYGIGLAAQTAILGHLSAQAIGANSIAITVASIFLITGYSGSQASGVIMGEVVGANMYDIVRPLTKRFQIFFLCLGTFAALLLLCLTGPIISFYKVSDETAALTRSFMIIMAVSIVGSVYEYPLMGGIIAGGGNPKYQTWVDTLFMWVFTIPLSYLSAFVFEWPVEVTFILLKADQLLKCIPNAIYCNSFKWVRDRTRADA